MQTATSLPPGQHRAQGFPRFGTHLNRPAPRVPAQPVLEVTGAGVQQFHVALAELADLPRREQVSDLHCVSGWSATGLHWSGVPFADFFRARIAPALPEAARVTHVSFCGLDRYRSIVTLEDALGDDVLLADHLDGRPLDTDHGAPLRLLSPGQYGFISTKHLCRIELHEGEPDQRYHPNPLMQLGLALVKPHPRARVWHEERHRHLPAWAVRPVYRRLIAPIRALSARGSRPAR